jgi:hypothetical protein
VKQFVVRRGVVAPEGRTLALVGCAGRKAILGLCLTQVLACDDAPEAAPPLEVKARVRRRGVPATTTRTVAPRTRSRPTR